MRNLSLRNYYLVKPKKLARLIMVSNDARAWINDIPVMHYPISNNELPGITSIESLFEHFTGPGVTIPARLQRALPLDELLHLAQLVPGAYLNTMASIVKKDPQFSSGSTTASQVITAYYRNTLADAQDLNDASIRSYINCCMGLNQKLNMTMRSANRFFQETDEAKNRRTLDKVPVLPARKEFDLGQTDFGPVRIERIKSKKRLIEESDRMKTCVLKYGRDMAEGACALYHVQFEGQNYTLELQRDENERLIPCQLKGVSNTPAPKKLETRIRKILKDLQLFAFQPASFGMISKTSKPMPKARIYIYDGLP